MDRTRRGLAAGRALRAALVVIAATAATAAGAQPRPVAVSGQTAPDTGGRPFYFLDVPALNDAGQVAFNAWLPNTPGDAINPTGIWSGAPGALRLNARRGQPSPAPNEPPYAGLGTTVAIDGDGGVLFSGAFAPREFYPNPTGLFAARAGDPAAARAIATTQQEAPEARSKQFFDYVDPYPLRLGAGGHAAFTARLAGKEIQERVNDTGVWRAAPGTLQRELLARAGSEAPGTGGLVFSEGVRASGVAFHPPAVDRLGNAAFVAHLRGEEVDDSNERGLWYSDVKSGALSMAARHGQPLAPGSLVNYLDISYEPTIANGRLAFHAVMYGPPPRDEGGETVAAGRLPSDSERFEAIVTGPPDALKIAAATLTRPAGADYRFEGLTNPVINSRGEVLFGAALAFDGRAEPVDSLWAASGSARRMLVLAGDAAPGAGGGAVFRDVSLPSFNDAGDFVFFGDLAGAGVGDANDRGIWAGSVGDPSDPDAGQPSLTLVAREGQVLDLGDGLPRTVRTLEMLTGTNGGEDGAPSAFNDSGQLAFVARFTDGSNAVLIAAVPEPAGVGVLVAAGALVPRRRRRP